MSKLELIEVNELKAYLIKLYSPGDQSVTETDRVVNRIFDFLEVLPIIKLEVPTIEEHIPEPVEDDQLDGWTDLDFMNAVAEEYRDTGRPWSAIRIEKIAKRLEGTNGN